MLGAEADDARAFRPPPPELEDEDLRLTSGDSKDSPSGTTALRDLGDAEPTPAPVPPPRRIAPEVARTAIVVPDPNRPGDGSVLDSVPWLMPFVVIVCVLGALAIVLIAALGR